MTPDIQHLEALYGETAKGEWRVRRSLTGTSTIFSGEQNGGLAFDVHKDDAAFIAAIHTAFPQLLDRLKAEEERVRVLEGALESAIWRLKEVERNTHHEAEWEDLKAILFLAPPRAEEGER